LNSYFIDTQLNSSFILPNLRYQLGFVISMCKTSILQRTQHNTKVTNGDSVLKTGSSSIRLKPMKYEEYLDKQTETFLRSTAVKYRSSTFLKKKNYKVSSTDSALQKNSTLQLRKQSMNTNIAFVLQFVI